MTTHSVPAPAALTREAPSLGGFNLTVLRLEIRRLLRNRRTVIFALIFPVVFFLAFGLNKAYANLQYGHGNVSAEVMISMALYGAVLATTSGGAMVSIERAAGWSRQLRLTPLSPVAYIVIKMLTAMVLGLASVIVVFAVGGLTGKPSMPMYLWIVSAACVWIGSLVFAAFGLFMGYLLPTENVMQFLGLGLAAAVLRWRPVHPAEPVPARGGGRGRVHPALRPQPARARAAARRRRPAVLGGQRRDLAGHLRRGRRLAVPQGHRPGLSPGAWGPGSGGGPSRVEPPAGRRSSFCTGPRAGLVGRPWPA